MVYVFLADGFEEIEAVTVIDVLRRAEVKVVTVSVEDQEIVTGVHGIPIFADITMKKATMAQLEMIVLPGGTAAAQAFDVSTGVAKYLDYANKAGIYVAAICAAPIVLGRKGYLKERKVTCYPGLEKELRKAEVIDADVVIDRKLITARGPGAATEFALNLVRLLKGEGTYSKVRKSMVCKM